jgi:hypothetical protein
MRFVGSSNAKTNQVGTEMKRLNNVSDVFLSYENFDKAELKARKNKGKSKRVSNFDRKYNTADLRKQALVDLIDKVKSGNFKSTKPITFERMTQGGKLRNISIVPYFPDIVYAHAVLNVIGKRFDKNLIYDVYSYNRGVHLLASRLQGVLKAWPAERKIYVMKLDIRKFYESVDCDIMKAKVDKLVKDKVVKAAIFDILDAHQGLTIGMLLSQLFSGVYLSDFDHFVKEDLKVRYYYRYADDIVVLSNSKAELHELLYRMRNRLFYEYKLDLKYWQIFDIKERPLDYVGYIFHRTHTRVRTKIKKNFAKRKHKKASVAAYMGVLKYCNSKNLIDKILIKNNYAKKRNNSS